MNDVTIYTDGSCPKNPGRGGYAALVIYGLNIFEITGAEENSTNNRMEIMAAIAGIEYLKEPHKIKLYSDSAYLVDCFKQRWFEKWYTQGWKNGEGKPIKNKDLWLRLFKSLNGHKIEFIKVKGHSDDVLNNRCDELARLAVESKNVKEEQSGVLPL